MTLLYYIFPIITICLYSCCSPKYKYTAIFTTQTEDSIKYEIIFYELFEDFVRTKYLDSNITTARSKAKADSLRMILTLRNIHIIEKWHKKLLDYYVDKSRIDCYYVDSLGQHYFFVIQTDPILNINLWDPLCFGYGGTFKFDSVQRPISYKKRFVTVPDNRSLVRKYGRKAFEEMVEKGSISTNHKRLSFVINK